MKKIVYLFIVAGCLLQADTTGYTRIAWTEVPTSALKTDDFYTPNQVQQEQEVQIVEEIETPAPISSTFYVTNEITDNSSKEDSVKLATPEWIFVD